MKAIAEYFRDLAADDRYFGAEPPQPDAQMLARIAQREISQKVDAREDEGRIVLSAREAPQAAALVATQALDDVADAIAEEADEADAKLTAEDVQVDEVEVADLEEAVDVAADAGVDLADDASMADKDIREEAEEPVETPVATDEPDIVPSLPDADVEAFFADSAASDTAADDEDDDMVDATPEPAQEQARADSIADKLKRIRAVVSQQPDEDNAPDYSEDQHADANAVSAAAAAMAAVADTDADEDEDTDVLSDTLRDIEDALEEDDAFAAEASDTDLDDLESEDDDISAILSRLEKEAGDDVAADADDGFEDNDEADDTLDADDLSDNIMAAMDDKDADVSGADNLFEDKAPEPVAAAPLAAAAPKPAAPRARVLKVKRATLEAAIQSGQLEEYDEDEAPQPAKAPLSEKSSLSDEAEEELARELAELEADMQAEEEASEDEGFEDETFEDEAEPEAATEEAAAPRAKLNETADESFSRLMDETEQQLGEPEGTTRRDAFAHLRAAVAAKKADEAVGGSLGEVESDEPYRDDLASVVRPRRPASGERSRTERPSEPRPAPLKLVAEQRIDTAEPRRVTPVRPRRVAAPAPQPAVAEAADAETSFADFAADMGASELPDLLEAAAAYLSFVEGHAEFSRPQLMTKVRQVEKENFTREDGLRSFGKLLREGKIEKLKGGRFQASEQIGFKPDARAAS